MRKILFVFIILLPAVLCAEIYKMIDEKGRVVFTDKPTPKAEQIEVRPNVNSADDLSKSAYSKANNIKRTVKQKTVVMYSTSWCGVCTKARKHMKSEGIKLKEYDIEKDKNAHSKYVKLGGKGVPLITVGNQKMSGFSASRLQAMLK
jgi:glutaredoxin